MSKRSRDVVGLSNRGFPRIPDRTVDILLRDEGDFGMV